MRRLLLPLLGGLASVVALPLLALVTVLGVASTAIACPAAVASLGRLRPDAPVPAVALPWIAAAHAACPDLPEPWIAAIMMQESGFRPDAYADDSNGGTWGLFQLNQSIWTATYRHPWSADLDGNGIWDIKDPLTHARVGGKYLCRRLAGVRQLRAAHPDWPSTTALTELEALALAHMSGETALRTYPTLGPLTAHYLAALRRRVSAWTDTTAHRDTSGTGSAATGSVFLVGDSLTVGTRPYLPASLTSGSATVKAEVGASTAWGLRVLRTDPAAQAASIWLIALGTNDSDARQTTYAPLVEEVLRLAGTRRLLWVDAYAHGHPAVGVNAALRAAAARHPTMTVIGYAAQIATHPTYLAGDETHLTPAGYRWRAGLYAAALSTPDRTPSALEAACGSAVPAPGPLAATALAWAVSHLGDAYVAGAHGPHAFDCSTFTFEAYSAAGLDWPMQISYQQYLDRRHITLIPLDQAQPGDLLFFDTGAGNSWFNPVTHVALVLDPVAGTMIGAENPHRGVAISNYKTGAYYRAHPPVPAPDQHGLAIPGGPPVAGRVTVTR